MRLDRDGVRLAVVDFGGEGPAALLLHGLAGHAGEWTATGRWLTRRRRAIALDAPRPRPQRAHAVRRLPRRSRRRRRLRPRVAGTRAGEANVADLARSLARWPAPFASHEVAVAFFGGPSASAEAWADGPEHRDGGWWPRLHPEVMARTLREATRQPSWAQ